MAISRKYQVKLISQPLAVKNLANLCRLRSIQQPGVSNGTIGSFSSDFTTHAWQKHVRDVLRLLLFGYYEGTTLIGYAIMNNNMDVVEFGVFSSATENYAASLDYCRFGNAIGYIKTRLQELSSMIFKTCQELYPDVPVSERTRLLKQHSITINTINNIIESYNDTVVKIYQ